MQIIVNNCFNTEVIKWVKKDGTDFIKPFKMGKNSGKENKTKPKTQQKYPPKNNKTTAEVIGLVLDKSKQNTGKNSCLKV